MSHNVKRLGITALVVGCLLAVATPHAHSQRARFNPYARRVPAYAGGWGYTIDPYGSYLHGVADVLRATGDLYKKGEEVRSARIDNRRKLIEQWLWERDHIPGPEEERQRKKVGLTENARNASITEIWAGQALNYLLEDIDKRPNYYATDTPIDPAWLSKLNVTTGKKGGNFGLLKDVLKNGKIPWPFLLRRANFKDDRERLEQLADRAVKQAAQNKMDVEAIDGIREELEKLIKKLNQQLRSAPEDDTWTPTLYTEARSFISQFFDAVKVLRQQDAGQYVTSKYAAQGTTVGELVQYMKEKGLWFGAANPGDEAAYTALHKAMTNRQQ